MTLPEIVLDKIARKHRGKERAIKREDLLRYLWNHPDGDPGLTDREMRAIVKSIEKPGIEGSQAILSCERGYYMPKDQHERDYAIQYLEKKAIPLFEDIKRIRKAYPDFLCGEQMELF